MDGDEAEKPSERSEEDLNEDFEEPLKRTEEKIELSARHEIEAEETSSQSVLENEMIYTDKSILMSQPAEILPNRFEYSYLEETLAPYYLKPIKPFPTSSRYFRSLNLPLTQYFPHNTHSNTGLFRYAPYPYSHRSF